MTQHVYELVRTRIRPECEAEMLELRPQMIAAVRERFPQLIEARLIKLDDGTWLDIATWETRDAAERAAAAFSDIPEAAAMAQFLDEIVAFEHGVDAEPVG